jgi:uncharacterized protein YjiK
MKQRILFIYSLIIGLFISVKAPSQIAGYDLGNPDATFVLPDILREISGATYIDSSSIACIQDENGILFIYDLLKKEISKHYTFGFDGDYEGITLVGKTIYVLRSDGFLFEISNFNSKNFKMVSYATGIPANNNEGLCYDAANNRLLIASKGKIDKGPQYKDKRFVYGFDLNTKKLIRKPVFEFDVAEIKRLAILNKVNLPVRINKKDQSADIILKFRTSAINIHPFTKKLFLLSASDHLLFIFDSKGTIEQIEKLDPSTFNKAEGLTFFENGDMLITNEGQDKKATLLRFNYSKK